MLYGGERLTVPGDAYICHYPKTSLADVRGLKFVTWAELYPQAVKISPALRNVPPVAGGVSLSAVSLAAPGELDATPKTVDVVLHRNANAKKAAKQIAEAAHVPLDEVQIGTQKVRLSIKARRLADVSALDAVRHIEEVLPAKLHNSVARQVLRELKPTAAFRVEREGKEVPLPGVPNLALRTERAANVAGATALGYRDAFEAALKGVANAGLLLVLGDDLEGVPAEALQSPSIIYLGTSPGWTGEDAGGRQKFFQ